MYKNKLMRMAMQGRLYICTSEKNTEDGVGTPRKANGKTMCFRRGGIEDLKYLVKYPERAKDYLEYFWIETDGKLEKVAGMRRKDSRPP